MKIVETVRWSELINKLSCYPARIVLSQFKKEDGFGYVAHQRIYDWHKWDDKPEIDDHRYSHSSGDYAQTLEEVDTMFFNKMKRHEVKEDSGSIHKFCLRLGISHKLYYQIYNEILFKHNLVGVES